MRRGLMLLTVCFTSLLSACNLTAGGSPPVSTPATTRICAESSCEPTEQVTPSPSPRDGGETDAPVPAKNGVEAGDTPNTYKVPNPSSGASLYAAVYYPDPGDVPSQLPALVLVPGGSGDSGSFIRKNSAGDSTVSILNAAGFIAVVFDPDGRGKSTGAEDYDGYHQQDGLAEVIRFAAALPEVDPARIGLVTFSYGVTMGSGALARHPDLPAAFLVDWEGPANRNDTGGCDVSRVGHLKDLASCTDDSFWAEREAAAFIGRIRVPYQRMQSEKDHAQPDYAHMLLMINTAVRGGVPWVRLNGETPNQTYTPATMPEMTPESMDGQRDTWIVRYASELFGLV